MTTLFDVAKEIKLNPLANPKDRSRAKALADIVTPASPRLGPGLYDLNPAQLAGVRVDPFTVSDGETRGYQRPLLSTAHVRKLWRHLEEGGSVPPVQLAINGSGEPSIPWCVDGQHRSIAAILAGRSIKAVVEHLSHADMRQRFNDQNKAKRIDRSLEVMTGTAPADRYVQLAITDPSHAWHGMVGLGGHPLMSPSLMHSLVSAYVRKAAGTLIAAVTTRDYMGSDRFNKDAADELSRLIAAFGTHLTNPPAFRAIALRAITGCAIKVLPPESANRSTDLSRWHKHMPKFKWQQHAHMTSSRELTFGLLQHWNMRLPAERRVQL